MRRLRTTRTCREGENPPFIVTLVDSNAPQTETFIVESGGTIGIMLSDSNASQTDGLIASLSSNIADSNNTQTDEFDPAVVAGLADSNATSTDSLTTRLSIAFADFNASQTDVQSTNNRFALADSSATPTDAISAKLRASIADSSAAQTDALISKIRASIADSNAAQTDALVATVRASMADSNATQTDALATTLIAPFPAPGALYVWRADLGITGGPTPITSWTDQIVGKVLASTGWNSVANDANFGNKASVQSTGLTSFLSGSNFTPAVSLPYWFFFVARNTNASTVSAIWDQGPTTTTLVFGGGNVPNGQTQFKTNANQLGFVKDIRSAIAGAVFVGGNGQTSKVFMSAQTPGATQANIFADGTIVNHSSATIGNRAFDDQAVTSIAEFGIANNTFDVSSWLGYAGVRYGISIGP